MVPKNVNNTFSLLIKINQSSTKQIKTLQVIKDRIMTWKERIQYEIS